MKLTIRILICLLVLSLPALAVDFRFASFDFPTCASMSFSGLNVRAQVTGLCFDDSGPHGFLLNLDRGTWTKFEVPGSLFTNAAAINARGQIVGRWTDAKGVNHVYLRDTNGRFTSFDPTAPCAPSRLNTVGHGINDIEEIVGRCWDANDNEYGFLRHQDGTFNILEYPDAVTTDAWWISNAGEIVGDYSDSAGIVHGFILTGAEFKTVDFPTARHSALRYINERGDITGIYANSDVGPIHAFLLKDGVFTTIDFPGSVETDVLLINNSGLMAGGYNDAAGQEHGFVAVERK